MFFLLFIYFHKLTHSPTGVSTTFAEGQPSVRNLLNSLTVPFFLINLSKGKREGDKSMSPLFMGTTTFAFSARASAAALA
jgi:hypothetical protein